MNDTFETRIDLSEFSETIDKLRSKIKEIIVGQDKMIDLLLIAIISDGHILIEGVPGVAKTLTARLLAKLVDTGFSRIQFTPDLMPADIIGTSIFNNQKGEFEFKKGPVFSNIVLIDEINRAPAKTQSALFEVMEERNITVDGQSYPLENPFIILGTQNPVEHEGTYRLPEAQLDRFLFKIEMGLPNLEEEIEILTRFNSESSKEMISAVEPCLNIHDLNSLRKSIKKVHVEEPIIKYIAQIINETRNNPDVFLGASPRASLAILTASKANAIINGKDFVTPDDIKFVINSVLIHRIVPSSEKEIEGITTKDIINSIIRKIEIPR